MNEQTKMFRCRVDRKLITKVHQVAEEIGTSPGEIVRLLFKQLVKRRTIPFPLQADTPEDEAVGSRKRRSEMWDQMNEGHPPAR